MLKVECLNNSLWNHLDKIIVVAIVREPEWQNERQKKKKGGGGRKENRAPEFFSWRCKEDSQSSAFSASPIWRVWSNHRAPSSGSSPKEEALGMGPITQTPGWQTLPKASKVFLWQFARKNLGQWCYVKKKKVNGDAFVVCPWEGVIGMVEGPACSWASFALNWRICSSHCKTLWATHHPWASRWLSGL